MKREHDPCGYSPAERDEMLGKMRTVSDAFYFQASRIGAHAFIEFAGLMNEFIKICSDAEAQGIDFSMANTHSGKALPIKDHHIAYLAEKLDCIFGPMLQDPAKRKLFVDTFLPPP